MTSRLHPTAQSLSSSHNPAAPGVGVPPGPGLELGPELGPELGEPTHSAGQLTVAHATNVPPRTIAFASLDASVVHSFWHEASVAAQPKVQSRHVTQPGESSHAVASFGHASTPQL